MASTRRVSFESHGSECRADLRLPDRSDPPVVVMGNGFGATRDILLSRFAEQFRECGIATFAFDYRGFGNSEGPSQRIDPFMQVEDWCAAVDAVRNLDAVDGSSVGLWGTSISGGHVIETATRREVSAVVAQVPFVDGFATLRHILSQTGIGYLPRALGHGLGDIIGSAFGRGPHRVPIVAPSQEFGVLNVEGAFEGYKSLLDVDHDWTNECDARVLLQILRYRPLARASRVDAPTLVVIADRDQIVPPTAAERLLDRLPDGEALRVEAGHFDVNDGESYERAMARECPFYEANLTGN